MKKVLEILAIHFAMMCREGVLFTADVDRELMWQTYFNSFTAKYNQIYIENAAHDCTKCNNFVQQYGNIISITPEGKVMSLWDCYEVMDEEYKPSFTAMYKLVHNADLGDFFKVDLKTVQQSEAGKRKQKTKHTGERPLFNPKGKSTFPVGVHHNWATLPSGKRGKKWYHLALDIPIQYLATDNSAAAYNSANHGVLDSFINSLESINEKGLKLVRKAAVEKRIAEGKKVIAALDDYEKTLNLLNAKAPNWQMSYLMQAVEREHPRYFTLGSTLIGKMVKDISSGTYSPEAAFNAYNKRMGNYKQPQKEVSKAMKDRAVQYITDNNLTDSFNRKSATPDDIRTSDIFYLKETNKVLSIFDNVQTRTTGGSKGSEPTTVSMEHFLTTLLPKATELELFVDNSHAGNFMTMFTGQNNEADSIFTWGNPYSITYINNKATRDFLEEAVVAAGGRVDAPFIFRHEWNRIERNESLMDLHILGPSGLQKSIMESLGKNPLKMRKDTLRVGWDKRKSYRIVNGVNTLVGHQDVDHVERAKEGFIPTENIYIDHLNSWPDGDYQLLIHNYSFRSSGGKGKATVVLHGKKTHYIYPITSHKQWVHIATVSKVGDLLTLTNHSEPIDESPQQSTVWNIQTNNWHKVNLFCPSPNHWRGNTVGNKHYLFFLEECKPDNALRAMHNNDLIAPLQKEHRIAMEAFAKQLPVREFTKDSLAGVGFNTDKVHEILVRINKRPYLITINN